MSAQTLESIARALVAPGRGILAADESFSTIGKRFKPIDLESTEEHRRAYRDMLFTAPGIGEFISGVILFDETIRQKSADGTPFPQVLSRAGVVPGIKVDAGTVPLAGFPDELVTEGLDGLRGRLDEYYKLGARFAKWRAVITIGAGIPTEFCICANAHALARYAALCQEAKIVPIVEPEVLMDADNSIERCDEVTRATLRCVFTELVEHRVVLEQMLLKPNMVIAGKKCARQAAAAQVAEATVACLRAVVPAAVPGIVFLSGGQSEQQATEHLNLMNRLGPHPWSLSFSYGRALQDSAIKAWAGKKANVPAGQKAFLHRARMNAAACRGKYTQDMERAA
jgi:fructose-bisphosphate aldolase class I